MEREIKFKRVYKDFEGKNFEFADWGPYDDGFISPSYIHHFFYVTDLQYTGSKDKNGVNVCEGDICEGNWPYAKRCIVTWDVKRCGFYLKPLGNDFCAYDKGYKMNANKFEIIGNRFLNPELLEQ